MSIIFLCKQSLADAGLAFEGEACLFQPTGDCCVNFSARPQRW
jgi:hypothetical protein